MSQDIKRFNRLSINEIKGAVYTDTVVADYTHNNNLLFTSVVVANTLVKPLQKVLNKNASIYFEAVRKYINNNGCKYDVIKRKMANSDYTHMIFSRRDKVDQLTDGNELYDFVVYAKDENEVNSKLYDKIYKWTSIPVLEEWMPVLRAKLVANNLLFRVGVTTIHEPANLIAYRILVSKVQLQNIVSNMLVQEEVSINNSHEKSDVIDCVEGLDSYLNIFGDILADRIQNSFVPKYDPETKDFDQYVNNYDDSCFHNGIELYDAQKATIQAAVNNFKKNNVTFVIGEMGCGKTALGAGIAYADYGKKAGSTSIVLCPSHLVEKWKREVEKLVPNAKGYIVKTISDLLALDGKIKAKVKMEHTFIIMSKENAKFSYETRPSALWSVSKNTFVCPECGQALTKKIKIGSGRNAETITVNFGPLDMMRVLSYNETCMRKVSVKDPVTGEVKRVPCNAKLWTPVNKDEVNPKWIKLGKTGWIMKRHIDSEFDRLAAKERLDKKETELFSRLVDAKNAIDDGEEQKGLKAPRKYSIAKYVRERYKGLIDYCIADELHEYKGDSKQGMAMADIACASKKFIGLTGTLLNGYADGLFYILYRTLPSMMKREGYDYSSEAEFMRSYGVIRKESSFRRTTNGTRGDRINGTEKRLPGVSPLVFTKFLLENAVFISLSDMDGGLPAYSEIPIEVDMDDELKEAYESLERELRNCVGFRGEGGMKAMGSLLQCLSVYPDMPYNQPPVIHPDTDAILVTPPELPEGLRAKEERLLELVQQKLAAGEKVLVYYEWTNKTDIAQKLTRMFDENGIKSAVLTSSVSADSRETWIENKLDKGLDVLICNPKLVETGLDLLAFTTIVFYQVGYNVFTMRQASRRSWRLSQTKDIEVYFIYYKDTIQDRALKLMATKLQASMAIEGKFSEEGLRAMSNNEDLLSQIAQSVVDGIKDTVEAKSFGVTTERSERSHDTSRVRASMKSLLVVKPDVAHLSYLARNFAINNKKKTKSHKATLSGILNNNIHVGNLL